MGSRLYPAKRIVTNPDISSSAAATLTTIKVVHTIVWGFFVSCIVAIPIFASRAQHSYAALFVGLVSAEVLVLVFNSRRCPLSTVAARSTEDRRAQFDIYLPEWLARHNVAIFGALSAAGVLFTLVRWART